MRTWTPKLGSRRLIDFSTPSNTTAVNFLLWFSDIRDSETPSRLNQDCLTDDLQLAPIRPSTHVKEGRIQPKSSLDSPYIPNWELDCLTYCSYLPFYPFLSFLWPPTSFPSKLSFPIFCTSKTTNSPLLSLLILPRAHISEPMAQVNCH